MVSQFAGLQTICTAEQILSEKKSWIKYSTGSSALDTLLLGGIESRALTEVYGDYGTGKTQLALTLCITAQLPDLSENRRVLFIDTQNTFRAARLHQIAENRSSEDPREFLKRILVLTAFDSIRFEKIIASLNVLVRFYAVSIVIVDSLISLYRGEYAVNGTIFERQQRLNQQIHTLKAVGDLLGCAVVVTNQIQVRPGDAFRGYIQAATGGNIVGHGTTYRILLKRKGNKDLRK